MLLLYLDESGNYTFSRSGSEFLFYTALSSSNPYVLYHELCELERKLKARGIVLESQYFHASEDKQIVRDEVYKILRKSKCFEIDTILVEKNKTNPAFRDVEKLYKKIYGVLLQYIFTRHPDTTKVIIFLDEVPIQKKKQAILKGIKESLSDIFHDKPEILYEIINLSSIFSYGLQATDYCCWAFKKKYGDWGQKIDLRPYNEIRHNIRNEFNIFRTGTTRYY